MEKVEVFLVFKAFWVSFSDVLGTSSLLNLPSRSLSIHHLARAGACRLSACGKKLPTLETVETPPESKDLGLKTTQNDLKRLKTIQKRELTT